MTKLVDLEGKKKAREKPCPHCGAEKACPDLTCKRLKSYGEDGQGYVEYEYVTPEPPREVHLHFHGMTAEEIREIAELFGEQNQGD
jgi:hypothetical protein